MKVLIVHNQYKQYGGEDTVVDQEARAYTELGHEVRLFLKNNQQLKWADLLLSIFNFRSWKELKGTVKDFDPDVIHVHNFIFILSPSIFWVKSKKAKIWLTLHNYRFLCPSGTLFYKNNLNLESKTFRGLMKNVARGVYQDSIFKTGVLAIIYKFNEFIGSFKKVDKFIFLTPFAQDIHLEWHPKLFANSVVKPNFLFNSPKLKKVIKDIDVLFVGRFTIEKGILDVLPSLVKCCHLKIVLAGDGPVLEKATKIIGENQHITLLGAVNREKVYELLGRSKYLLFPSIWYEGMPMTIIEAYSAGVPVIARKLGAMETMIKHEQTGYLYSDLQDFEKIVCELKAKDLSPLSENAQIEFQSRYSFPIGKENLMNLMKHLYVG
ncbi:glycosyltransferase family 4 protein [Flagellimonas sediminis]|uniref:Glycosyltransferase n=1 Tax=Flagellimonas sediminis TaxID=2696468 RepID=A0A6I5KQF7_9FLAO|nr:glycosyltransferase family 4 protein [Allomuricauda sediminis]NDV42145.1 glycosyltransferase [Allomuricauda sediminis]